MKSMCTPSTLATFPWSVFSYMVHWVSESVRTQVKKGFTHNFSLYSCPLYSSVHSGIRCRWIVVKASFAPWILSLSWSSRSPVAPQLASYFYTCTIPCTIRDTIHTCRTMIHSTFKYFSTCALLLIFNLILLDWLVRSANSILEYKVFDLYIQVFC